jgi:4-carboxymuconolactone decarboxylase
VYDHLSTRRVRNPDDPDGDPTMARLPDLLDTLTPDARQVYEKIAARRGAVRGPFAPLMHHPALAERVGDLGEYLRFGSTLPGDVRELAILLTARAVGQAYEWTAHAPLARKEGLPVLFAFDVPLPDGAARPF